MAGTKLFYPAHSPEGKLVFVRQLRGRSTTKVMGLPPAPTVRASALDPTCERLVVKLRRPSLPSSDKKGRSQGRSVRITTICRLIGADLATLIIRLQLKIHAP